MGIRVGSRYLVVTIPSERYVLLAVEAYRVNQLSLSTSVSGITIRTCSGTPVRTESASVHVTVSSIRYRAGGSTSWGVTFRLDKPFSELWSATPWFYVGC